MRGTNQLRANATLCVALALLFAFCATVATAQTPLVLPISPKSGSLLVGEAFHRGAIQLPPSAGTSFEAPALSCSPTPCVLPNVQASGGTNIANEDPIAFNPRNPAQLLTGANDYSCTSSLQGFYASSDAGSTWTRTCLPVLAGGFGDGDPMVGYDLNNVAYAGGIQVGTPGQVIVVSRSTNNGTTWSAPVVAAVPTLSGGTTDKGWLEIDTNPTSPNRNCLYVSNTQFDANSNSEISVSHSCDGAKTWVTKVVDTKQIYPASVDQFSDLAIGKDGTVYVSWMRCPATGPTGDCGGTTAKMLVSKSTDQGNTWSAAVTTTTATLAPDSCGAFYGCLPNTFERVSNIPVIAIDNSASANAGHLYVVYYTWTGSQMKVFVTRSTNGGASWSAGVRVAPAAATHDQFFPWLNVAANGAIGATWLDRRNDPGNLLYDAYMGASINGATSFALNVKLTSVMSNPNNDGFGSAFMGDYTGNTIAGATLYASWMDMRNGSFSQDFVGGYKVH